MPLDKYIAKTFLGLESVLKKEIEACGGVNVEELNRAVSFEGDLKCLYKVNLTARTALKVLKPFLEFKAHNETVFYKRLRRYDWTKLIGLDQTFKVNSVVNSDQFRHSKFVALKTKDAIIDLFRLKYNNQRPSIDLEHPDFGIEVHCRGIDFVISLDSSGDSLHKRGYRQSNRPAPLNEALAAGMILLSGWNGEKPFLDPMCGSGTLLIEAFMIARNIAPRMNRLQYLFMNWSNYDRALWHQVRNEAILDSNQNKVDITGFEIDSFLARDTGRLISSLGYASSIQVRNIDFFSYVPTSTKGTIVTNPPYGKRLTEERIISFYQEIGNTLKQRYDGWDAWILSGNKEAMKKIGLRTSKKLTLFNGPIECKFHLFEMYQGSRK